MCNNCILCGETLVDGKCSCNHQFKKMCINCVFCTKNENDELVCVNEDNLNAVKAKMLEAASQISSGYSIDINLTPIALKNPLKKCGQWNLSDTVKDAMLSLFV